MFRGYYFLYKRNPTEPWRDHKCALQPNSTVFLVVLRT